MKIAVLNFTGAFVDIVTVDEEWLNTAFRHQLPQWYDDEEWQLMDTTDKIELFLFQYCGYDTSSIQYLFANDLPIYRRTPKDYN